MPSETVSGFPCSRYSWLLRKYRSCFGQRIAGGENLVPSRGEELRKSLGIGDRHALLRDRKLRDHFEHYDARLEYWAATSEKRDLHDLGMRSSGSTSTSVDSVGGGRGDLGDQMRAFDADSNTITFRGEIYQLQPIVDALADVRARARNEVQKT